MNMMSHIHMHKRVHTCCINFTNRAVKDHSEYFPQPCAHTSHSYHCRCSLCPLFTQWNKCGPCAAVVICSYQVASVAPLFMLAKKSMVSLVSIEKLSLWQCGRITLSHKWLTRRTNSHGGSCFIPLTTINREGQRKHWSHIFFLFPFDSSLLTT